MFIRLLLIIMGKWHFCQIDLMLGKCLQTALYREIESPSSPRTSLAYIQPLETAFSICSSEKVMFIYVSVKVAVYPNLCMCLLNKRQLSPVPISKQLPSHLHRCPGKHVPWLCFHH